MKDENWLPLSRTDTSEVPEMQYASSLALACQCGVRMAPGLMTSRLIDSRLRIGRLSAVTRRIEPRSDSSTISPSSSDTLWELGSSDGHGCSPFVATLMARWRERSCDELIANRRSTRRGRNPGCPATV